MKLADKPCYPTGFFDEDRLGLTFRERLIIALASNSEMHIILNRDGERIPLTPESIAKSILMQADTIIAEMEKE